MPLIGEIKYVKKFAWRPKNLFPQYVNSAKKLKIKDFIWLKSYYEVYKWMIKTWVVKNPKLQGWTWQGNVRKKL